MADLKRRDMLQSLSLGGISPLFQSGSTQTGAVRAAAPQKQKLVMIGAGSVAFTQGIILDWLLRRPEGEWEIALVDINPAALTPTEKLVRRYMLSTDRPAKITASVDRRDVLAGATVVVCTIGVGSRRGREIDVLVPRKYGIFQPVGDTVMAGGVSRAMRTIPPMVDIANDARRMCPNAIFINYSNPMTAIIRALRKKTEVKAVGLCIGTHDAIQYLAQVAGVPPESVTARWAGVNHLTWITEIRSDGEDLWPRIRRNAAAAGGILPAPPAGSRFCFELLEEFGAFPAALDRHVNEFFPERFPNGNYYGKKLGVDQWSFEKVIASQDKAFEDRVKLADEQRPLKPGKRTTGEHIQFFDILDSLRHDRRRWYSANIPNQGAVSNLPEDVVLEIPATAATGGFTAAPLGELPAPLAAVMMHRLASVEATVEAALTGNRKLMVEAMILDGGVRDYATAAKLTDELLKAHAANLPQFR